MIKQCLFAGRWCGALVLCVTILSCAPSPVSRQYPNTEIKPTRKVGDLGFADLAGQEKANPELLSMSGVVDTARVLRVIENIHALGEEQPGYHLIETAERMSQALKSAKGVWLKTPITRSIFAQAAVGETKLDAMKILIDNDQLLETERNRLAALCFGLGAQFNWPKPGAEPRSLVDAAENFVMIFLQQVQSSAEPRVAAALQKEVNAQFVPLANEARELIERVLVEPSALEITRQFEDFIRLHDISLSRENQAAIDDAKKIMAMIDDIDNSQHALEVLVDLWQLTPAAEREATFKEVSTDLYDLLKKKSDKDLHCLKTPGCGFVTAIIRGKVRSKLKAYGIDKIRAQLNLRVHEKTLNEITAQSALLMNQLPVVLMERIDKEFSSMRGRLAEIRENYPDFIGAILESYAKKYLAPLGQSDVFFTTLEPAKLDLTFTSNKMSLQSAKGAEVFQTSAETIGLSMSLFADRWERAERQERVVRADGADRPSTENLALGSSPAPADAMGMISQISKLLAIGGFRQGDGRIFPAWSVALDPKVARTHFNVRDLLDLKDAYSVPDVLQANASMLANENKVNSFSASGQAELLRGFSRMIRVLRDWEPTRFDDVFGKIEVREFISDLPTDDIKQKLFPKDLIFSLAVGNAAAILKNITKRLSPIMMISVDQEMIWAEAFDFSKGTPALVAGVVGINAGERYLTVRSQDVALYLLAILEFLEATNGIENTQASLLVDGQTGLRPLDVLIKARSDLKLLSMALANFLSHQVQEKDGGLRTSYSPPSISIEPAKPRLLRDQVLAVTALLKAAKTFDQKIYFWSAMDAFYFMNSRLWDASLGFYRATEGASDKPSLEEVVLTLRAGFLLRPYLEQQQQAQWDQFASRYLVLFAEAAH